MADGRAAGVGEGAREARRAYYLGPWRVDVTWRSGVSRLVPGSVLARTAVGALDAAGAPRPASIGLILADDVELAELDRVHMGTPGPTDVLSFPLLPPGAFPPHPGSGPAGSGDRVPFVLPPGHRPHLGDIVVSVERAVAQARAGRGGQTGDVRWSPADELRLLVTHGTLHVCGWDHAEPVEEAALRALELRLLGDQARTVTRAGDRDAGKRGDAGGRAVTPAGHRDAPCRRGKRGDAVGDAASALMPVRDAGRRTVTPPS